MTTAAIRHQVAFMRGINLGKRTVKGPEWTRVFASIGLKRPTSFLASGNVVFEAPPGAAAKGGKSLASRLQAAIAEDFGFEANVFLRGLDDVARLAGSDPFGLTPDQQEHYTVNVILLDQAVTVPLRKRMLALRTDYDDFAFTSHEAWWLCRGERISDSSLGQGNLLEKALGIPNTTRNLRTLQRLVARFGTV